MCAAESRSLPPQVAKRLKSACVSYIISELDKIVQGKSGLAAHRLLLTSGVESPVRDVAARSNSAEIKLR